MSLELRWPSKKFSSYMAAGAGNLPFPNIEAYREILSPTVAIVFNNFVISPTFPDTWKLSCVVPVYKSGKQTDPINYRQILLIFPLQSYSKRWCTGRCFFLWMCLSRVYTVFFPGGQPLPILHSLWIMLFPSYETVGKLTHIMTFVRLLAWLMMFSYCLTWRLWVFTGA